MLNWAMPSSAPTTSSRTRYEQRGHLVHLVIFESLVCSQLDRQEPHLLPRAAAHERALPAVGPPDGHSPIPADGVMTECMMYEERARAAEGAPPTHVSRPEAFAKMIGCSGSVRGHRMRGGSSGQRHPVQAPTVRCTA